MSNERMDRGPIGTAHPLSEEAEPLIHLPFYPDSTILVRFSGSFTPCLLSSVSGRHDDGNLICLTRREVNNPNSSMKSESVVLLEKDAVAK